MHNVPCSILVDERLYHEEKSSHGVRPSHASMTSAARTSTGISQSHKHTPQPDWSSIGHTVTQIWCDIYTITYKKPKPTLHTTLKTSVSCSETVVTIPPRTTSKPTTTIKSKKHKPTSKTSVHHGGTHRSSRKHSLTAQATTEKTTTATSTDREHSPTPTETGDNSTERITPTGTATNTATTSNQSSSSSTSTKDTNTVSSSQTTTSATVYAPTVNPSSPSTTEISTGPSSTDNISTSVPSASETNPTTSTSNGASATNNNFNPTSTTVTNGAPGYNPEFVAGSVSNKSVGIGLGVGIGCVAVLGLVGLLIHNKRKNRDSILSGEPNVQTRWRPQSFMAAVAAVASRLSRSSSQRSKLSTVHEAAPGTALGAGYGAVEHPIAGKASPAIARAESELQNLP
ncbi:hypothetical protein EC973_002572 [Apophysomyces ossiformis]|uniref:Uncharacterized protein n=1 Tax=Apophysomyces ossiformis TaxID=679940 RepID=A0A8H7EMI1_9FUNG|nr:hypothetical protein EC973_002572 [Apophysomyces ossiformis]